MQNQTQYKRIRGILDNVWFETQPLRARTLRGGRGTMLEISDSTMKSCRYNKQTKVLANFHA